MHSLRTRDVVSRRILVQSVSEPVPCDANANASHGCMCSTCGASGYNTYCSAWYVASIVGALRWALATASNLHVRAQSLGLG